MYIYECICIFRTLNIDIDFDTIKRKPLQYFKKCGITQM